MDVQRRARRKVQEVRGNELAIGRQQQAVGTERGDRRSPLLRAEAGRGREIQSQVTGHACHGRRAHVQTATGRLVGAADDEQGVGEVRQPLEERDAERAAAEERDAAQH